jgi:hypothetical protein
MALNSNRKTIGGFALGMAGLAFVAALAAFIYSFHFVRTAIRTDGRVVQLQSDQDDPTSFHTVFTFRDVHGQEQTLTSALASSPPEYNVGDTIQVLYQADSPRDAKVSNFFSLWGITFIAAVLGMLTLAFGMIILKWPGAKNHYE